MRLYLDERDGTGLIPCPLCGRPLLLAAERRGRWRVGYDGLTLKPGRKAMLICPDLDCDHSEAVEVVAAPTDAIIYGSRNAGWNWRIQETWHRQTLFDLLHRMDDIATRYRKTGHPKLPSMYRFWREQYRRTYWRVVGPLQDAVGTEEKRWLEGKEIKVLGYIRELLKNSVLVEEPESGNKRLISLGNLSSVAHSMDDRQHPLRFDFATDKGWANGFHVIHTPHRFVTVSGHRLVLTSVNRYGICRIETDDAAAAELLGLMQFPDRYIGEVPAVFVDRCFKAIRFAYVQGHKMLVKSITTNPDIFVLQTRHMDVAKALKMHRDEWIWDGEREQLRWWRYFHCSEIERWEEKQIPCELQEMIRLAARR